MAVKDNTRLWLKEFEFYVGTVNQPELIGVDNVDPKSRFSGVSLGWGVMGTTAFQLPHTFAQARSGTPSAVIRMDLTQKDFQADFSLFQVADVELWKLIFGMEALAGVNITTPSVKVVDVGYFGYDEPQIDLECFLFDGEDVFGRDGYIMLYSGRNVSTDRSLTFSGTDYAQGAVSIMAFPHPDIPDAVRALGCLVIEQS